MGTKIKEKAIFIFDEITKLYPNAACELKYSNPLELMIAIMLSAQTTDFAVNQVTSVLFQKNYDFEDYISVDISILEEDLRHLGLYKNKAKNIKGMTSIVHNEFKDVFPNNQAKLESLPGVGRKTANVFLAEWFKEPRIAVDTHVKRVSSRLGLASFNDSVEVVEEKLMKLYPK